MLTRLHFKNWRSLKDVTIDNLMPLTVFIGANASGKTNIIEALRFERDSLQYGLVNVVQDRDYTTIQTDAMQKAGTVTLSFSYQLKEISPLPLIDETSLRFQKQNFPFFNSSRLTEGNDILDVVPETRLPIRAEISVRNTEFVDIEHQRRSHEVEAYLNNWILKRWQILGEGFQTPLRTSQIGDVYVMQPDAQNTLHILNFMRDVYPEIFTELQDVFTWLMSHTTAVEVSTELNKLELSIQERGGQPGATISAGTLRVLAMLTAIHALDMPQEYRGVNQSKVFTSSSPGLVIIEEPDTALNPGLLSKFVSLLRDYTSDPEKPRQFIMTTHNPSFLSLFQPEEVRVVSRDDDGYTKVEPIPSHIKEVWLDEYGLGEVWSTRSFGGLPD